MTPPPLKLAVFGDPIGHSRSPQIHQAFAAQRAALQPSFAIDYAAVRCPLEQLPTTLAEFQQQGGHGLNLTLPLKQAGADHCVALSAHARASGAVNTLHWRSDLNGWMGHNTDGVGLMADLQRLNLDVRGRRVLIIGAGGATAGVLPALLAAAPAAVWVLNRSLDKAEQLCQQHASSAIPLQAGSLSDGSVNAEAFDLCIQASSAGHQQQHLPLSRQWLSASATVYDLNYGSAHQPVADWCHTHGIAVHDGLGMLVEQAAAAFAIWTGWSPQTSSVLHDLRRELN